MSAFPKPRKRFHASPAEWERLRELKLDGQPCRACGGWRNRTLHHLVGRDNGGDDVADNLIPLCHGPGSRNCHGCYEDHATGWEELAATIRWRLTPEEAGYVVERRGWTFLQKRYPPRWDAAA